MQTVLLGGIREDCDQMVPPLLLLTTWTHAPTDPATHLPTILTYIPTHLLKSYTRE